MLTQDVVSGRQHTLMKKKCSYTVWKFIKCSIQTNIIYNFWISFSNLFWITTLLLSNLHIVFIPFSISFQSNRRNRKFSRIPLEAQFHSLPTNWRLPPIHYCMREDHQSLGYIRHDHWHKLHINGFHEHPLWISVCILNQWWTWHSMLVNLLANLHLPVRLHLIRANI